MALAALRARVAVPPHRPFSDIRSLHFASVVVFETRGFAPLLVSEHNFDGGLEPYLDTLLATAAVEVHTLFRCCVGYPATGPEDRARIAAYLRAHAVRPRAYHVGNVGRPRDRVLDEARLRADLEQRLDTRLAAGAAPVGPDEAYALLRDELEAGGHGDWVRAPHARQTLAERAWPWVRIAGVVAAALAVLVLLWVAARRTSGSGWIALLVVVSALGVPAGVVAVLLRRHERRDVPMDPTTLDAAHVQRLAAQEDAQLQNHLASLTVVKPGRFRRLLLRVVLWAADLIARTSTKGTLSGIPSIHFAHWALLDGGRRLLFLSNYDGSWGSYLDDFIDKASTGLTAIWTNTVGFPRTRWLVREGARDGVAFKAFARMQQTPAAVWYAAYPNLTVQQIEAHSALREGLAVRPAGDALAAWLRRW